MEERKHIVILAAGDFPTHEVPLKALREADFVVCCDSAYERLQDYETTRLRDYETTRLQDNEVSSSRRLVDSLSFVVIGDGDSLSEEDKRQLGDRWIHVAEQDYNDLHKAMAWATTHYPLSTTHFTILAATGHREDHTLGNISYLVTFAEEYPGIDLEMLTDYGRFIALDPTSHPSPFTSHLSPFTFHLPSFPRQQVSIFTMDPDRPIYSSGLRWPLDGFHARRWWQASLNEALGTSFLLRSEGHLVVFQTHEPKAYNISC